MSIKYDHSIKIVSWEGGRDVTAPVGFNLSNGFVGGEKGGTVMTGNGLNDQMSSTCI